MRTTIILNQDGGTIRGMNAREFGEHIAYKLGLNGAQCKLQITSGPDLVNTLNDAAEDKTTDTIIAGGGDGTISAAAAACFKSNKTLGVIPLGTMNMFARSLCLPLNPIHAVDALAQASPRNLDIGTVNGRPFVHQFSVGLHARMVKQREKLDTSNRIKKIIASAKALGPAILNPPKFKIDMYIDDNKHDMAVSSVSISNNMFGNTALSYAAVLDEGRLGIYKSRALEPGPLLRMAIHAIIGRITDDPDMIVASGQRVTLSFPQKKNDASAIIDGELIALEDEIECKIHAGALSTLVPKSYRTNVNRHSRICLEKGKTAFPKTHTKTGANFSTPVQFDNLCIRF